jgi:hypothetical protein
MAVLLWQSEDRRAVRLAYRPPHQAVKGVQSALKRGLSAQEVSNPSRVKRFPACERAALALRLYCEQQPILEVRIGLRVRAAGPAPPASPGIAAPPSAAPPLPAPSPAPVAPPAPQSEGLSRALSDLDMRLVRVLAAMEDAGIALDLGVLAANKAPLQRQLVRLDVSGERGPVLPVLWHRGGRAAAQLRVCFCCSALSPAHASALPQPALRLCACSPAPPGPRSAPGRRQI